MKLIQLILLFLLLIFVSSCTENNPTDNSTPDLVPHPILTLNSRIMGNITYQWVESNEEEYYIIDKTEGNYELVSIKNNKPFIDYKNLERVYTQNPDIEDMFLSIDPNYHTNLNRNLNDEEMWRIIQNLFVWLEKYATTTSNLHDLESQAKMFANNRSINFNPCLTSAYAEYSLLLRLGIPRNKLAVANVPGNYFEDYSDGKGNIDIQKLIDRRRIKDASELKDFLSDTGGHYYTIVYFNNSWNIIDGWCVLNNKKYSFPTSMGPLNCGPIDLKYPHRIFVAPKNDNCDNQYSVGCQEEPKGVPLVNIK